MFGLMPKMDGLDLETIIPILRGFGPMLGLQPAIVEKIISALEMAPEIMPEFSRWLETERPDLAERIRDLE